MHGKLDGSITVPIVAKAPEIHCSTFKRGAGGKVELSKSGNTFLFGLLDPDFEGTTVLRNYSPNDTASHPRTPEQSCI
jgi:hypothetical protein